MKQFTSRLDFSVTKKRLNMLSKKASKTRMLPKALFVIPVFSILTLMFCADSENPYENMTHIELSALNKSMYYDIELESQGQTGLFHPKDERTGTLLGPDGLPYNGTRTAYFSDTDSLYYTETIVDGKKTLMVMNMYDSIGAFSYHTLFEYSLDHDGNFVTTTYSDRQTDSLVLSDIKTQTDSTVYHEIYHSNGNLHLSFGFIINDSPIEVYRDGLFTEFDPAGNMIKQERYKKGELVEVIK